MGIIGDLMRKEFGIEPKKKKTVVNDKIKDYAKILKESNRTYLDKKGVIDAYHELCKNSDEGYSAKVNYEYLELLAGYMTKDESFLKLNKLQINAPGFDKSIMLIGNIGSGKSYLLRNLKLIRNVVNPISGKFINEMELLQDRDFAFTFKNYKDLVIDDLGTNKDGLEARWMRQLAEIRHEKWQGLGFKTHFTTNKTPDLIEEIYGSRLRDRFKENCNIIVLKNTKSLRK